MAGLFTRFSKEFPKILHPQSKLQPCLPLTFKRFINVYGDGKTSVTILQQEEDAPIMISSYSQLGFGLNNGMKIIGPVAVFPKTVLSWNVKDYTDINLESLSLFFMMVPKLDILVIGVGDSTAPIDGKLYKLIRSKGVNLELLSTEHACTTFNFLNQEKRAVAGALIPPKTVDFIESELIEGLDKRKQLFRASWENPPTQYVRTFEDYKKQCPPRSEDWGKEFLLDNKDKDKKNN